MKTWPRAGHLTHLNIILSYQVRLCLWSSYLLDTVFLSLLSKQLHIILIRQATDSSDEQPHYNSYECSSECVVLTLWCPVINREASVSLPGRLDIIRYKLPRVTKSNATLRREVDASCDFESRWWCWASHYAPDCHHFPSSYKQHQSRQKRKILSFQIFS